MSKYTEDLEMYRSNMDSCWDAGDTPDLLRVAEGLDKDLNLLTTERSRISDLVDRAASDRSYDGDLVDDIHDILDGNIRVSSRQPK